MSCKENEVNLDLKEAWMSLHKFWDVVCITYSVSKVSYVVRVNSPLNVKVEFRWLIFKFSNFGAFPR